ncbi:DUF6358 family protein [Daejeonella oryzae]|uniref:DUF6358 family protein n=1 Tax=Daejeonella oryzae TaxID=1122943 RepID=UPI001C660BC1
MILKILINIFLNIAIFTLVLSLFWCFNHQYYAYGAGALLALGMFIYLKIRVIKSVRKMTKNP